MNILLTVARFEWYYHRRRSVTYLFACLIVGQGFWSVIDTVERYPGSSPSTTAYFALSSLGVVLAIVSVLLAGQSLTKDWEFQTANYLYTLPVTNRTYLAGRFLGTFLTALTLAGFYPLGMLASFLYTDPGAPVPWLCLADGFAWLTIENVFIVVSLAFSLTVLVHSIRGAYISLFLVILYFLLTETQTGTDNSDDIWHLLDPFGVGMIRQSIDVTPPSNSLDGLLSFSDMLLINRVLWLGLALGILAQAETAFSFQAFGQAKPVKRRRDTSIAKPVSVLAVSRRPHQSFTSRSRLQLLVRLTRLDFRMLVRQPTLWVTTALLILLTTLLATVLGQNTNFPELPITSAMTALRLPMGAFISLFLLVITGEFLFQERTSNFWSIADSLPQPVWVRLLPRLIALAGLACLLTGTLFLTSVLIQLSQGYQDIDWSLYAQDLIIDGLLRYCQLIALSGFTATLVNNRILSHVITLLVFGLLWLLYQFDSTDNTYYLYSFLPGSARYSNLTGYGVNGSLRLVVHAMWWGFASVLVILAVLLWNRGTSAGLIARIQAGQQRFSWPYGLMLGLSVVVWGWSWWHIQRETEAPTATLSVVKPNRSGSIFVSSISGKRIPVSISYHDAYQVRHILAAAQFAIEQGERLFGPFPTPALRIVEVPSSANPVRSQLGQLFISEKEGWTADYHQPNQVDYLDYLVAREVFKQWLTHNMHPVRQPGDGFLRQSLPEYLALCVVGQRYGPERLRQRLAQRYSQYITHYYRISKKEPTLTQSSGNDALERGRGAMMLSSIGQVWGDTALRRTIGQFYQMAIGRPASATASAFALHLTGQLPESLRYLTSYLTDQCWFSFRIGRIANLPNGLSVEIFPKKWRNDKLGNPEPLLINDLIPLTVLDQNSRPIYMGLVRPEPDGRWVRLPALPGAHAVILDPFGTWPEIEKRENRKIF